jgi:hypothetical protein
MMVTITIAMMFDNDDDLIYKPTELANKYIN